MFCKQHVQDRLHLKSGIPFAPGSSVALQRKRTEGGGCVTFWQPVFWVVGIKSISLQPLY